jgi:hypothetical protein
MHRLGIYLLQFVAINTVILLVGNTSYSQENWTKFQNSPVLERDTIIANLPNDYIAISDPWVIKQGTVFKMWYTCGGINYPADEELRSRICYCESPDGVNWIKYAGNPVLDVSYNGDWDSLGVETVSVLIDDLAPANERYKMWYAGQYFNDYRYDFGYAYSPDGKNWTKHPGTVMEIGNATSWEGGFIEGPSVLKDGNVYKMWYTGYDLTNGKVNTGYATSPDGISWTKYAGNPVITTGNIGEWDSFTVQDPHVLKIGTTYHMWYGGMDQDDAYGQETGYAFSSDGIAWTKSTLNPVLQKGSPGDWDDTIASFPSVLLDNGVLKMWYTGKDVDPLPANSTDYYWEIGYATDITGTIGVEAINEIETLGIFPNPSSDVITLKLNNTGGIAALFMYDISGKQLEVIMLKPTDGKISIAHLTTGWYTLKLVQNERTFVGKLIVSE